MMIMEVNYRHNSLQIFSFLLLLFMLFVNAAKAQPPSATTYTLVNINGKNFYEKKTETEDGGSYNISISAVPARFRNFHVPLGNARKERASAKQGIASEYIYNGFTLDWHKVLGLDVKLSDKISPFSYGFLIGAAYQPMPKIPLLFGLNMGAALYASGTKETSIAFSLTQQGQPVGKYAIPVFVQSQGYLFNMHLTAQFIAPIKFAQPYMLGMAGFQNISSGIKLFNYNNEPASAFGDEEGLIYIQGISSATAYSLAIGGGLLINLSEHYNLDLRALYSSTGKVRYFSAQNISDWQFAFDGAEAALLQNVYSKNDISHSGNASPKRASLDMLMVSIGLNVLFR